MKALSVLTTLVLVTMSTQLDAADNTWSCPFEGANFGKILHAGSADNWIMFVTAYGVGAFNRSQTASRFTYFTDLGFDFGPRYFQMAIGDSSTVALFEEYGSDTIHIVHGASVKTVECPESFHLVLCEPTGALWIGADSAIYRFNGDAWSRYPYPASDFIAATNDMLVCRNDSLIFTTGNGQFGCLYNGTMTELSVEDLFEETESGYGLFNGPNGNPLYITNKALYDLFEKQKIGNIEVIGPGTVDSIGNIWMFEGNYPNGNSNEILQQYTIATGTTSYRSVEEQWYHQFSLDGQIFSNSDGVTLCFLDADHMNPPGFLFLYNNSDETRHVSYDWLPGNEHSGLVSFYDYLYYLTDGSVIKSSTLSADTVSIRYREGQAPDTLSSLSDIIVTILEHPDGTLYAGTERGLYHLNGSAWEQVEGLADIPINNLTVDNTGKIWGTNGGAVFHEFERGWKFIDHTNSNLPEFTIPPTMWINRHTNGSIRVSSDNEIWAVLDTFIVKTVDGVSWETHTLSDFGITVQPANNITLSNTFLYKNRDGSISFVGPNDSYTMIRGTSGTSGIHLDTLVSPDAMKCNPVYVDRSGGIWARRGELDGGIGTAGLYRLIDDQWYIYDSTNAPFSWGVPYNEIPGKEILLVAGKNQPFIPGWWSVYISFSVPVAALPVHHDQVLPVHSAASTINAYQSSGNSITVKYAVADGKAGTLALYSAQGRLVKKLEEHTGKPGTFSRTFSVNFSCGVYFIRLSNRNGTQAVNRIILR